jgi:hypothetical protein
MAINETNAEMDLLNFPKDALESSILFDFTVIYAIFSSKKSS